MGTPTLLFLHGFMGSSTDWGESIHQLSADFHCLAVDLPGHGRSGRCPDPNSYNMNGSAKAIAEVLDLAGIGECVPVGYSMGGRLALYFAIHHPQRCAGLVIESASPGITDQDERTRRRSSDEKLALQLESGDFDTFLRSWYNQPVFDSLRRQPMILDRILERRRENDPAELAKSLRGMGAGVQPSLWQDLSRLQTSVLVMAGEMDLRYKKIAQEIGNLRSKVQVAVVPGAGHNVHVENPAGFVRALRHFLTKQE